MARRGIVFISSLESAKRQICLRPGESTRWVFFHHKKPFFLGAPLLTLRQCTVDFVPVYMGPLHRLASFLNASASDLNNNNSPVSRDANVRKMGVKGKKCKFASDLDLFNKQPENSIQSKAYIWTSIRLPTKKNKGEYFS